MAYHDTHCPCGDSKERDTMLCGKCDTAFADRPEMAGFKASFGTFEYRRSCAISLLSMARRRKGRL